MLKFIFLLSLFISNNYATQKHNYLLDYYKQNEAYNKNTSKQYKDFFDAYQKSLEDYENNITKYWENKITTSNHIFVQYSNNFKQRTIMDYKKSKITIQVISKNAKIAQKQIVKRYEDIFKLKNKLAFRNELVLRNTYRSLGIVYDTPINDDFLIGSLVDEKFISRLIEKVSLEEYQQNTYKEQEFFTSSYNLPKDFKQKNENRYLDIIKKHAKNSKIPFKVYFAIIKVNTSFNPYARDKNARFSLMRVQSKDIGLKAYYKLYKDYRILDASYLYNINNNLFIASTYFNMLYYDEFKNINDAKSKMYLSVLAYEIGLKKTLDLFSTTKDINTLNSSQVYKKILKKLKNRKVRIYFSKVTRLML